MSDWLRRRTTVLFNCGTTRVRGNYSRLEVEAFGTHQVDRTDRLFCPQTSALSPNVHFQPWTILHSMLHCIVHQPAHLLSRPALIFSLIHSPRENRTQIRLPESINTFHPVQRFTLYGQYTITEKFGPQMGLSRKHKYAAAPALLDIPNLEQASATKSLPEIA